MLINVNIYPAASIFAFKSLFFAIFFVSLQRIPEGTLAFPLFLLEYCTTFLAYPDQFAPS